MDIRATNVSHNPRKIEKRMNQLGIWKIDNNGAQKIPISSIGFEKELEDLIERNPSLIETGFQIIGRQLKISCGTIDILGLDTQGRFTVIEVKRGDLFREAVAQAIDYASEISELTFKELKEKCKLYLAGKNSSESFEEIASDKQILEDDDNNSREVNIKIVGIGKIDSVERMIKFLTSKANLSIEAIGFQLFEIDGEKILLRELNDTGTPSTSNISIKSVFELANEYGTEPLIKELVEFAEKNNLKVRPYKTSLMIAPKQNGNRCLFTVWIQPHRNKLIQTYIAADAFEQFYSINIDPLINKFESKEYPRMNQEQLREFLSKLETSFCNNSKPNLETGLK